MITKRSTQKGNLKLPVESAAHCTGYRSAARHRHHRPRAYYICVTTHFLLPPTTHHKLQVIVITENTKVSPEEKRVSERHWCLTQRGEGRGPTGPPARDAERSMLSYRNSSTPSEATPSVSSGAENLKECRNPMTTGLRRPSPLRLYPPGATPQEPVLNRCALRQY